MNSLIHISCLAVCRILWTCWLNVPLIHNFLNYNTLTFGGVKYLTKVIAGLAADGRQIVGRTKSEANNYESLHGSIYVINSLRISLSVKQVVLD
ncbi:unnamed protein product [Prunus armeniaca]|uniref:Uncharacterized protein n=1 Tax=Prunus armeniaca TaxID=36596 RepID=A0A6J5UJF4_PRUAR|nr:unnamed protein product [Prunus armeniaca]